MKEDNGYSIIQDFSELRHWEIIYVEDYKLGVKRLHLRKIPQKEFDKDNTCTFRKVYCKEEILKKMFGF